MSFICPYDGHIVEHPQGDFCADHGAKWFMQCHACGALWPTKASRRYVVTSLSRVSQRETGANFCAGCGMPGPWLTRPRLIEWLRSNVKASPEISATKRLELLETLTKLEAAKADDTRTVEAWKMIRDAVPKVWEMMKPARDALIGEAVKKLLGL